MNEILKQFTTGAARSRKSTLRMLKLKLKKRKLVEIKCDVYLFGDSFAPDGRKRHKYFD